VIHVILLYVFMVLLLQAHSLTADVHVILDLQGKDVILVSVLYVQIMVLQNLMELVPHVTVLITGLVLSVIDANLSVKTEVYSMKKLADVNVRISGKEMTALIVTMLILTSVMNVHTMEY